MDNYAFGMKPCAKCGGPCGVVPYEAHKGKYCGQDVCEICFADIDGEDDEEAIDSPG